MPSHVSRRNRVVDADVVVFMAEAAPCRGPSVDAIELRCTVSEAPSLPSVGPKYYRGIYITSERHPFLNSSSQTSSKIMDVVCNSSVPTASDRSFDRHPI